LYVCVAVYGRQRDLHSFPTRRSSDLKSVRDERIGAVVEKPPWGIKFNSSIYKKRPFPQEGSLFCWYRSTINRRILPRFKSIAGRSEEHTSELQSRENLVCRLLLEKKK